MQPSPKPRSKEAVNKAAAIFDLEPPEEDIRFRPSKAPAGKEPTAATDRMAKATAAFSSNSFAKPRAEPAGPPPARAATAAFQTAGLSGRDAARGSGGSGVSGAEGGQQTASGRGPWGDFAAGDPSGASTQPFAAAGSSPAFGSPVSPSTFRFGESGEWSAILIKEGTISDCFVQRWTHYYISALHIFVLESRTLGDIGGLHAQDLNPY